MNTQQLLDELSEKLASGELKRSEVMHHLNLAPSALPTDSRFSVSRILYILGAAIVIVGIIFFVSQIWDEIGSVGRIAVTLGFGLLITLLGSMLLKDRPKEYIGSIFHFIGGMLIPGGAMVTLSELSVESVSLWPVAITFGAIFAFYMLLNNVHKNAVLTFFAIANGTACIYLTMESVVDGPFYSHGELYAYLTILVGIGYLLIADAFQAGWNKPLVGILHFFGSTGVLSAAFSRVFDSLPWQLFYIPLIVAGLFLSVSTKSRIILVMSTIFIIAYVTYITSEYFANSIGWPISLVLLGFIFIGLGYASIAINKKYIAKS